MTSCYLYTGETIKRGQQMIALNETYNFIHQYDGNLVLYHNRSEKKWESGTSGTDTSVAMLQEDGNFVLLDTEDNVVWSSGTENSGAMVMYLQDNGDLALVDPDHNFVRVWGNGLPSDSGLFDHTKIPIAGALPIYASLFTPDKEANLQLTGKGDITMKNLEGKYRALGAPGGKYLTLEGDGNLCLYGDSSTPVWQSDTKGSGARAAMLLTDCTLVLVDDENTTLDNAAEHTIKVVIDANTL